MKKIRVLNILSLSILVFVTAIIVIASKNISDEYYYRFMSTNVGQYDFGTMAYNVSLEDSNKANKSVISGYIFQYKLPKPNQPIKMYLHNVDTNKNVWVKLKQQDRPDVEAFYEDGTDYTASGFIGEISNRILKDATYQIYICFIWDQYYYALNKYIVDGQLVDTVSAIKPDGTDCWMKTTEVDVPEFSNDKLMHIVNSARLCSVMPHTGSYVYQLKDKLYFIAGKNVSYNDENNCEVNWTYRTCQIQKLPPENVNGNYGYIFGGFDMATAEDISLASDGYRVMVYNLPEYCVDYMYMACYASDETKDENSFRIDMY